MPVPFDTLQLADSATVSQAEILSQFCSGSGKTMHLFCALLALRKLWTMLQGENPSSRAQNSPQ